MPSSSKSRSWMEFSIAELTLLGKSEPASLASQDMPCRVKGGGGNLER